MSSRHKHPQILLPVLLSLVLGFLVSPPAVWAQDEELDHLLAYLERNDELLMWAEELVSETESVPARRVLEQANNLHHRSVSLLQDGRFYLSFGTARRAREAIWSAVGQAREAMGLEERLRIRAERFRDMHGNLLDRARDMQNEEALELLQRAEHQAIRARELYLQGDLRLAMKLFENAEALMRRAGRMIAESFSPEQIDREIERVTNHIEHVRERVGDGADPATFKLLAEADEALDRSRESRDNGQPGRALQMAALAGKLARRAAHLSGLGADEEGLQRQLDRFDQRMQRIGDNVRDSGLDSADKMFQRALDLRERARISAGEQQFEQALRQIRAAHDLLNHTEDLLH